MTTTQLINEIIYEMQVHLNSEQMLILQNVLADKMQNIELMETTALSTETENNDYYIQIFLAAKSVEGCSHNTTRNYEGVLKRFFDKTGLTALRVDANHIRAYLYNLEKQGLAKKSINSYRKALSSFYSWLFEEGYIQKNECKKVKVIKEPKTIKAVMTADQVVEIRDVCKNDREIALIDLLESTGLRCDEVCKLKIADIDLISGKILVHGKGSKDRYCFLSPRAKKSVATYIKNREKQTEYLFYNVRNYKGLGHTTIHTLMRDLCERAGLKGFTVHSFRHYFCTELIRRGMNPMHVKELMGHESVETTNKVYTHLNVDTIKTEFMKFCA